MIGLTSAAATLISASGSALRFDLDSQTRSLTMTPAHVAAEHDEVVLSADGVAVFIAPAAQARLQANLLDADLMPCRPAFYLR